VGRGGSFWAHLWGGEGPEKDLFHSIDELRREGGVG